MSAIALVYIAFTIFLASAWRIVARKKSKPAGNEIAYTLLIETFASLASGVILLAFLPAGITFPHDPRIWAMFLLAITMGTLADYLVVIGVKYADLADSSVLLPLGSIWTLVLAAIFLHETIPLVKVFAVAAIVLGSVLTLTKSGRLMINRGVTAMFFYGWAYAFMVTIDKGISNTFTIPLYATIGYGISAIFLYVVLGKHRASIVTQEYRRQGGSVLTIGAIWALYSITLLAAYTYADVSTVIPLMRLFIIIMTIYSIVILKERDRLAAKIAGSIIVTAGALLLAYVG